MNIPQATLPHPFTRAVGALVLFVLIGVLTAAVGELQYSVFIRGDWVNFYGSMVFNAVYLSGVFVVTRLLSRLFSPQPVFGVTIALAAVAGLMVEWFLIGNSPWGNPDAAQLGMAAYWACLVVVPLIVIDAAARLRPLKRTIALYGLVYTVLILLGQGLIPPGEWRVAFHIWTVIIGYPGLIVLCVAGYLRRVHLSSTRGL